MTTKPNYPRSTRRRILLVEDHPVTREGFARLLDFEPDLQVCGQAGTAAEALAAVTTLSPDLVIVDISLGERSGLELLKDLSSQHPGLLLLVLSTHDENVYAVRSLRAGARGYVMKSAATDQILEAIRRVLDGRTYVSEQMNDRLLNRLGPGWGTPPASEVELLSDRELEVYALIGEGRSTAQIAVALNLSPNTVATHRAHIQEKLHLESLNELHMHAAKWVHKRT